MSMRPTSNMNKPLTRSEVAIEATWNLTDLFATRDEWLAELAAVEGWLRECRPAPGPARRPAPPCCSRAWMRATPCWPAASGWTFRRAARGRGRRQRRPPGRPVERGRARRARARGREVRRQRDPGPARRHARRLCARRAALERLSTDPRRWRALRPRALSPDRARAGEPRRSAGRAQTIYGRRRPVTCGSRRSPMRPAPRVRIRSTSTSRPTRPTADASVRRAAWASFCAGLAPYQPAMGGTFATEVAENIVLARRAARRAPSASCFTRARFVRALRRRARHPPGRASAARAPLRAPAPARSRPRQAAVLRRRGAARSRLCPGGEVRGTRRAAGGCARALGAGYVGARAERVPAPLDRPRRATSARHRERLATPYGVHSFILMTWTDSMRDASPSPTSWAMRALHAGGAASTARRHRSSDAIRQAPSIMNEVCWPAISWPRRPTRACAAGC